MSHRTLGALMAALLFSIPVAPLLAQTPSCLDYMPDPREEAVPNELTQADALVTSDAAFLPSVFPGILRMQVYPWTAFHALWVPACRHRDYHGQPWSGTGSAVLVSNRHLLTAGHLFPPASGGVECQYQKYVFGYGNFSPGQWQMTCDPDSTVCWVNVPEEDVYECQSVKLGGIEPGTSGDWAVVTLDRGIQAPYAPLRIIRDPDQFPGVGSPVTIVGHPNRIPMKVESAEVKTAGPSYSATGHFLKGHSGGMVVDNGTGRVIGIAVSVAYGGGGHQILPGCQPQDPPGCYREWFDDPTAGAWLTPTWLAKDYIPEP